MLAWVQLDSAAMPDGGELRLMRRGTEFSIMAGAIELMNSRLSSSEEALATMACDKIAGRTAPRILIGGLGMGFTLRAALGAAAADAAIMVAELVPAVIAWARGPLAPVFGTSLQDSRVEVQQADVGKLIGSSTAGYDAILLDVDNGPEGLTRADNDRLYGLAGLQAARAALRPGGVLGVWSSEPNPAFARRLEATDFSVEEIKVRAHRGRGARHVIWLATKRGPRTLPRR